MKKYLILFVSLALLNFAACSPEVSDKVDSKKTTSMNIVASFYPLAYTAESVGGQYVEVHNLAGSNEAHDYMPTPKQMTMIHDPNVSIFYLHDDFEPWAHDVISELKDQTRATEILSLMDIEDEEEEGHEEDEHDDHEEEDHDDHEEEKHDDHEEESHDEHDHGDFDPHVWLDPVLMKEVVSIIAKQLSSNDPEHAVFYEDNAQSMHQKLDDLDQKYKQSLAQCDRDEAISSHDAFGYIAKRYGFILHPIAGLSTHDEPSAKLLAELKEEAEEGITHILTEQSSVTHFAETLATETGLTMLSMDPLEITPSKDYFAIMEDNLRNLATALGCH